MLDLNVKPGQILRGRIKGQRIRDIHIQMTFSNFEETMGESVKRERFIRWLYYAVIPAADGKISIELERK